MKQDNCKMGKKSLIKGICWELSAWLHNSATIKHTNTALVKLQTKGRQVPICELATFSPPTLLLPSIF